MERTPAQMVMRHPVRFVQQFALRMFGLIVADELNRSLPHLPSFTLLLEVLQGAAQYQRAKGFTLEPAAGCAQRHRLTRLRRHALIAPLG